MKGDKKIKVWKTGYKSFTYSSMIKKIAKLLFFFFCWKHKILKQIIYKPQAYNIENLKFTFNALIYQNI